VFLGLAIAFARERLRTSIRGQEELTSLGLPVLGSVPRIKGSKNGGSPRHVEPVLEAMRGIRLNLAHSHGTAGTLMTTVTSPDPGDGKSFVAANLALAFAHAGQRTMLIDGDVRRGSLHRVLDGRRKPGLTDFLTGSVKQDQLVQKTKYQGLDFIGCGTRTSRAPEYLSASTMTQLITSLKASYSVILIDSPPIGAGVDALSLGTMSGSMVLVVRSGATNREAAEAKLDMVDRLPIRLLGAVVNAVRERDSGYYYGYYMPGYEYEDEAPEEKAVLETGHQKKLKKG
jgi:tyrosine-protein kinase Etk/Wzc